MSKRKRRLRNQEPLDLAPPPTPAPWPPSTSFLARLFSRKDAEALLREKIMDFAYQPRFGNGFERALELYFGKAARNRTLVADEEELPGFQEWYFFDFVLPSGRRLVDRFAEEVGPTLPEAEARLLAAWREMNRLRLFEVQSVMPGTGVVVLDLLSGETLTVNDRSASRSLRRWMVILARPSQAVDRICFTGSSTALTPMYKKDMLEAAQKLWDEHRMQYPEAAFSDFYRDRSLDLLRAMQRLQEEAMRPPIFLSAEGHKLMEARAEYVVRDFQAVVGRLDSAEEFVDVGPSDDEPDATHFDWLLRGRSNVPETPAPE